MSTKLETTWASKTIQAYKDAAREAGLVLVYDPKSSSTDFPNHAVGQLERLKKVFAMAKNGKVETVITSMTRQNVGTVDKNGKRITKEYLTYSGEFRIVNHRGEPYSMSFEIGKHNRPRVVSNMDQKWDPNTGEPLKSEKILAGQETVYDIEITDKNRKQIIDSVIADNDPDSIQFYYKLLTSDGIPSRRDNSYSYQGLH